MVTTLKIWGKRTRKEKSRGKGRKIPKKEPTHETSVKCSSERGKKE